MASRTRDLRVIAARPVLALRRRYRGAPDCGTARPVMRRGPTDKRAQPLRTHTERRIEWQEWKRTHP